MSSIQDDELILLWRQGASAAPDPAEIARLAGVASMKRFDRAVSWRNLLQYLVGLALCPVFVWQILTRPHIAVVWSAVALVCVVFILGYIWRQHRDLKPLDPSADARTYQAAILDRIDKQIRLLDSSRYWYLGPLCIPFFSQVLDAGNDVSTWGQLQELALFVGIFTVAAWLSERWGGQRLKAEREMVERLYED
jgi:hypothetical protein